MKRQTEKRQEKIYLRFFLFSLEATGIKLAHFALEISPQQEINPLFLFLLIFFIIIFLSAVDGVALLLLKLVKFLLSHYILRYLVFAEALAEEKKNINPCDGILAL